MTKCWLERETKKKLFETDHCFLFFQSRAIEEFIIWKLSQERNLLNFFKYVKLYIYIYIYIYIYKGSSFFRFWIESSKSIHKNLLRFLKCIEKIQMSC
jgi:hypothetical protein